MRIQLSCPSKTFLVGEYAVLVNGPALVMNTEPRFELRVERGEGRVTGLPEGSPALKWLKVREPVWAEWDLEFVDPHQGQGGFGASGAQFLLSHTFTTLLQSSFGRAAHGLDWIDAWRDHQVLTESGGSGADVLSQIVGGVAQIEMVGPYARPLAWPYPELTWNIVRTHQKVPTHEHLSELNRNSLKLLASPAMEVMHSFGHATAETFLGLVRDYTKALTDCGLQAPAAQTLTRLLSEQDWCLLAKGCGALGADTVLAIFPVSEREKAQQFFKKQRLMWNPQTSQLSEGVRITISGACI